MTNARNSRLFANSQVWVIILLLVCTIGFLGVVSSKPAAATLKKPLLDFPLVIGAWTGMSFPMEVGISDFLELSDYLIADYRAGNQAVNLYIAYYDTLSEGAFPHSPKLCIPGGGWEILDISNIDIGTDEVRRVVINRGKNKQIVYYWYQQESEFVADEYRLKWRTFLRVFKHGRSDTSLVRLTSQVYPGEDEAAADARLEKFLGIVKPEIMKRLISVF